MKIKAAEILIGLLLSSLVSAGDWGPDLIEFDLEGGAKLETMLWISGWSYSSTEHLHAVGCLHPDSYVESEELIVALNQAFSGERIDPDMATAELGRYIRETYPCEAYNKAKQAGTP